MPEKERGLSESHKVSLKSHNTAIAVPMQGVLIHVPERYFNFLLRPHVL